MIKNEKQYGITKTRLVEFKAALKELENQTDIDEILKKIQIDGVKSQIEEFEEDIKEYETLRSGNVNFLIVDSFKAFQITLIKARIIKGWTQAELAAKVELQEQQIQRYEASNYASASLERLSTIASALDLDIEPFKVAFGKEYNFSASIDRQKIARFQERLSEKKCLIEI